jgi:NADH-quinone oxidoreductase subunit M
MVFALQFAMIGTFVAQDLFLFYLFWEAMLIPLFFIIGIWGGERRIYATLKFVLYTAFGSILMLAAMIYLVYSVNATTGITSFAFTDLYKAELPLPVQTILLAAFALSFAIKVPIVPLHTWLPDAHVEAPTAGSVILAGVLLKMGTYGFMKLAFSALSRRRPPVCAALWGRSPSSASSMAPVWRSCRPTSRRSLPTPRSVTWAT